MLDIGAESVCRTDRFEHAAGCKPIADVMHLVCGVRLLQFVEQHVVGVSAAGNDYQVAG